MEFDPLLLSRIQFAFTVSFHILFPSFTIGLASYLAVLEGLWLWTGRSVFHDLARFWSRIFAVSFGMGVVSGVVMSYQFGTNWSRFSVFAGNIVGPLIGYEVLTAFFLEATFLGIMLFGWGRVPRWLQVFSAIVVAIGTMTSAFWILAANSWMQTPAGHEIREGIAYPLDWLAVIFNPSFPYRLLHMLTGCILTAEQRDLAVEVPPGYRAGRGDWAPPAVDWWRGFGSRELTALIEQAQTGNFDIGAAIGRIMQADAQSKIVGAPLLQLAGFTWMCLEDHERARRFLDRAIGSLRTAGAFGALPFLLASRSMVDFRTGRWASAYAAAWEAVRLAEQDAHESESAFYLACLARVEAAQGREAECRTHLDRAFDLTERFVGLDTIMLIDANCPGMLVRYFCVEGDTDFFRLLCHNLGSDPRGTLLHELLSDTAGMERELVRTNAGTASARGQHGRTARTLDASKANAGGASRRRRTTRVPPKPLAPGGARNSGSASSISGGKSVSASIAPSAAAVVRSVSSIRRARQQSSAHQFCLISGRDRVATQRYLVKIASRRAFCPTPAAPPGSCRTSDRPNVAALAARQRRSLSSRGLLRAAVHARGLAHPGRGIRARDAGRAATRRRDRGRRELHLRPPGGGQHRTADQARRTVRVRGRVRCPGVRSGGAGRRIVRHLGDVLLDLHPLVHRRR